MARRIRLLTLTTSAAPIAERRKLSRAAEAVPEAVAGVDSNRLMAMAMALTVLIYTAEIYHCQNINYLARDLYAKFSTIDRIEAALCINL